MSQEFKTGPLSAVWAKLGQYRMWVLVSPAFLQVLLFFKTGFLHQVFSRQPPGFRYRGMAR